MSYRHSAAIVLAVLAVLVAPACALADNYVVTRQDDPDDTTGACASGGSCSLRQAINTANGHAGSDVVTLGPGDYVRSRMPTLLSATDPVTIAGAGARATTIDGGGVWSTLIMNASGAFAVRDVTITGGAVSSSGGGISVANGSLTLTRVAVVGNRVQAICITGFGEPAFGGGVSSGGSLAVVDSLIANNHADGSTSCPGANGFGGGIAASGPLTVTDSTVTGNDAGANAAGSGGGISENLGSAVPVVLRNATVAGNTVVGGVGGNLLVSNSMPTVSMTGSIVAGGSATPGSENCSLNGASVTSGGGNVEDRNQCGLGAGDRRSADPQLAALADNGGPTNTRAIPSTSPAFDFAGACGLPTDQRGVSRPQGAACDAGAFELGVGSGGGTGGGGSAGGGGGGGGGAGGTPLGPPGAGGGPTASPGPSCTIAPAGDTSGLRVKVSCAVAASVTLGGDVTLVTRPRVRKSARLAASRTKTVGLNAVTAQVPAGTAFTLKVGIPRSVISAVKHGARATARLTLAASAGGATSQASSTFTVKAAKTKKRHRKR